MKLVLSCWILACTSWKLLGIFQGSLFDFRGIPSDSMHNPNKCIKSRKMKKQTSMGTKYVFTSSNYPSRMRIWGKTSDTSILAVAQAKCVWGWTGFRLPYTYAFQTYSCFSTPTVLESIEYN